ncbi:MAG: hypothetical protein R6W97_06155 [Thiobacillus sp.]
MREIQHSLFRSLLSSLAILLLSACAAPTKTEVSYKAGKKTIQATQEAIVLFPMYVENDQDDISANTVEDRAQSKYEKPGAGEIDFMRCLKNELAKDVSNHVKLVDAVTFQDTLFPWFETGHAPSNLKELKGLLARPLVRERITSLGVRYLVNIAGNAETDGFPGMFCGGGFGAAGCLGLAWEDKTHQVNVVIWDVVRGTQAGALSSSTSGRSIAFAFVVPIMFVANTERDACKALAKELGRLLVETAEITTGDK